MATRTATIGKEEAFFLVMACLMAAAVVSGFATNLLLGRVTFAEQSLIVHVHAFLFFGWMALYVTQNALIAIGSIALHRRLGWLAVGWVPAMVLVGEIVTVRGLRLKGPPPGFAANHFLFGNTLILLVFAGLVAAAVALRRRTAWHRRLMYCGTAGLIGVAIARMLPMPLLGASGPWLVFGGLMLFPLAGAVGDVVRRGRVHPAWGWGMAALTLAKVLPAWIGSSAFGHAVTRAVLAGSPQAGLLAQMP